MQAMRALGKLLAHEYERDGERRHGCDPQRCSGVDREQIVDDKGEGRDRQREGEADRQVGDERRTDDPLTFLPPVLAASREAGTKSPNSKNKATNCSSAIESPNTAKSSTLSVRASSAWVSSPSSPAAAVAEAHRAACPASRLPAPVGPNGGMRPRKPPLIGGQRPVHSGSMR